MVQLGNSVVKEAVRRAVDEVGLASAAIFVVSPGSSGLELAAAAGVEGPALERLVEAVRDPAHPIARAITDNGPTFDVHPVNPGGPALRSHLPLVVGHDGRREAVGVLAVAHQETLNQEKRRSLERLADAAAASVDRTRQSGAPA